MNNVKELIYSMLVTSTGMAMGDSGGSNGRHWQRNQEKTMADFQKDPEVYTNLWNEPETSEDLGFTVSLFHYLSSRLSLNDICNDFNTLECEDWDSNIFGVSLSQEEWLRENGFKFDDSSSWNSYNGEETLSQTIQGKYLSIDCNDYVLLQIHQGADVRGGYTDAKLFLIEDSWLDFTPLVYGDIDSTSVDTSYNGITLLNEDDKAVKLTAKSKINLYLSE